MRRGWLFLAAFTAVSAVWRTRSPMVTHDRDTPVALEGTIKNVLWGKSSRRAHTAN